MRCTNVATITTLLLLLFVLLGQLRIFEWIETTSKGKQQSQARKIKLGDGCYHVFLDVGSNVGVHARFIYEPNQYPNILNTTKDIFSEHFGAADTRDPRDICVFAFEPNPVHQERHQKLKEAYGAVGIRYHPIMAGVSNADGNLTFYHQGGVKEAENNEWGFSTTEFRTKDEKEAVEVPVLRLKSWLEDNIYERMIPEKTFGGEETLKKDPSVVMKMDIEGTEYQVLPDLMATGVLCNTVNFLFGEWHTAANFKILMAKYENWNLYLEQVMNIFSNVDGCKLEKFLDFDDESYNTDGIPLPIEPWWGNSSRVLMA